MSDQLDIRRYFKYPVILPEVKRERIVSDYSGLLKTLYIIGLIVYLSSFIIVFIPYMGIPIYIIIPVILAGLYIFIPHLLNLFRTDYVRLAIESEAPFFLSTLRFLSGDILDRVKRVVGSGVYKYISNDLRGVEDASNIDEFRDVLRRSRSPFLSLALSNLMDKGELLLERAFKIYSDHISSYIESLTDIFRRILYAMGIIIVTPVLIIIYQSAVTMDISDAHIVGWVNQSIILISIAVVGLMLITISSILLVRPPIYPTVKLKRAALDGREKFLVPSIIIFMSMLSLINPLFVFILIALIVNIIYIKYSTATDYRRITEFISDFTYLYKEGGIDFALEAMQGKYDKYLLDELKYALDTFKSSGKLRFRDPNLDMFFRFVSSEADYSRLDRYSMDFNSLLNIYQFVSMRESIKPYLKYIVILIAFIPIIFVIVVNFITISLPIFSIFHMLSNLTKIFGEGELIGLDILDIPMPRITPLTRFIFEAFTYTSLGLVVLIGLMEALSNRDYNPRNILLYTASISVTYIIIGYIGEILGSLIGL